MIYNTLVETPTVGTKVMFVAGKVDDTVVVTPFSMEINYNDLTVQQKTAFDNYVTNLISTDSNVEIINLPNSSVFSVDYITDSVTMVDGITQTDYTLVSGTVQGYVDEFNQLIIDLLP